MSFETKHLSMSEARRAALRAILLQCNENFKSELIVISKSETSEHWLMLMLLKIKTIKWEIILTNTCTGTFIS